MPDASERIVAFAEADGLLADVGDEGVGVRHVAVAHHRSGLVGECARGMTHSPISDRSPARRPEEVRRSPDGELCATGVVGAIRSRAIAARTGPLRVWAL